MSTPILISIEGNIGSGKTTCLKRLREMEPDWVFIDEPVDSWLSIRNDAGESLLEVFYKDIKRWSYTFQNAACISRGQMIMSAVEQWQKGNKKSRIVIMERCLETDRNVFAKMLRGDGAIDKIEWTLYDKWYSLMNNMLPSMDCFVWIDTEPNVCYDRIKIRAREGEDGISHEYLSNLDKVHHEWLTESKTSVFRSQNIDDIRNFIKSLE
jgi:deoxyguanosine kinase